MTLFKLQKNTRHCSPFAVQSGNRTGPHRTSGTHRPRLKDVNNVKLSSTLASSKCRPQQPRCQHLQTGTDKLQQRCPAADLPTHKIDLRGFAMPTPSRKINSPFRTSLGTSARGTGHQSLYRRHHPRCLRRQSARR